MAAEAPRMTLVQRAYESYAEAVSWAAHDGSPLPRWDEVVPHIQLAWGAFAGATLAGADLEAAYHRAYLGITGGQASGGGPAPAMAYLRTNRPQAAAAWAAAHRRAGTGVGVG